MYMRNALIVSNSFGDTLSWDSNCVQQSESRVLIVCVHRR